MIWILHTILYTLYIVNIYSNCKRTLTIYKVHNMNIAYYIIYFIFSQNNIRILHTILYTLYIVNIYGNRNRTLTIYKVHNMDIAYYILYI